MAEVKVKNGYLRIANNLYDNLYFRDFSKRETLIISLIIRLSYGFNKKTAIIKPKTWFTACGLYQPDINKILRGLIAKKVIKDLGNNKYSLNKNYDEWLVDFPKTFNVEKFNILKMLQQVEQNTNNEDSKTLLENIVKNYEEVEQKTIQNDSNLLSNSKTLSNNIVNCYEENLEIEQKTIQNNSKKLSNNIAKNYTKNAENAESESDLDGSKDNKDNKDITNNINIYSNKKFDPYFNNPIVDTFKKEYEKVFNTSRCYLDNLQINKLVEIGIDNPDFIEKIPVIISKFKKIKFPPGISKFNLRGLINDGKWAGILNGEYDQFIEDESAESAESDGVKEKWTL